MINYFEDPSKLFILEVPMRYDLEQIASLKLSDSTDSVVLDACSMAMDDFMGRHLDIPHFFFTLDNTLNFEAGIIKENRTKISTLKVLNSIRHTLEGISKYGFYFSDLFCASSTMKEAGYIETICSRGSPPLSLK